MKSSLKTVAYLLAAALIISFYSGHDSVIHAQPVVLHYSLLYKTIQGNDLYMHRFRLPKFATDIRRPAMVFFFGGGWVKGNPKQFFPHSEYFAKKGIVCFSAECRVEERHGTTPFDAVEDGKSAVRWIRQHATQFGIEPNKIVAAVGSAWGHLAACTATIEDFDNPNEDPELGSKPNALVLFNSVVNTGPEGYGYDRFQSRYRESSPVYNLTNDIPPIIIFHGIHDTTVPGENIHQFKQIMENNGIYCEIHTFGGMKHRFFNFGRNDNVPYKKTIAATEAFLKQIRFIN